MLTIVNLIHLTTLLQQNFIISDQNFSLLLSSDKKSELLFNLFNPKSMIHYVLVMSNLRNSCETNLTSFSVFVLLSISCTESWVLKVFHFYVLVACEVGGHP